MHINVCSVQKMVSECVIQIGANLRSQKKGGGGQQSKAHLSQATH